MATRFTREHVNVLTDILANASYKWKEIASALDLPVGVVQNLEARWVVDGSVISLRNVFLEWVVGGATAPTVQNLKKALRSKVVGLGRDAIELERNLKKHGISPTTLTIAGEDPNPTSPQRFNPCNVVMISCCVVLAIGLGIVFYPSTSPTPAASMTSIPDVTPATPVTPIPAPSPSPAARRTSHTSATPTSHTSATPTSHTRIPKEDGHASPTESTYECLEINREGEVIERSLLVLLQYRSRKGQETELRILDDIASGWKTLGILFELNTDQIAMNNAGKSDFTLHCCEDLVDKWIKKGGTKKYPPTWRGLISALKAIQLKRLADDIEEALGCVLGNVKL